MSKIQRLETDILIIGSESAGGVAAIEADKYGVNVIVVTKGLVGKTGVTNEAGRTLNAPRGYELEDKFYEDVVCSGFGMSNQKIVEMVSRDSLKIVMKLISWGAEFLKNADGNFVHCRQPGMRYRYSFYTRTGAWGSGVGKQVVKAIGNKINTLKNVTILEDVFVTSLLKYDEMVVGVTAINLRNGDFMVINAKSTILATGGVRQMYSSSFSSVEDTGDGFSLSYRAGAKLIDMEFHLFYPNYPIGSELWPGRGGTRARGRSPGLSHARLHVEFYNKHGERFMRRYDPVRMDYSTRAIMSCAIGKEIAQERGTIKGGVWASIAYMPHNTIDQMKETGPFWASDAIKDVEKYTNPRVNAVEIRPKATYYCGGIEVNEKCETNLQNLYAAGEVAGGFDGANRLSGNALTFCLVSGVQAGKSAAENASRFKNMPSIDENQVQAEKNRVFKLLKTGEGPNMHKIKTELQDLMEKHAASWRTEEGLTNVIQWITQTREEVIPKLRLRSDTKIFNIDWKNAMEICNLLDCAEMLSRAALMRTETRPCHQRGDFQFQDDRNWWKNITVEMKDGKMHFDSHPVVTTRLKTIEEINELTKYASDFEAKQPRWVYP